MPIESKKRTSPSDYAAPTSSARRPAETLPKKPAQPAATALPPRAVNARIDGDLADAWDERLTALSLPRGAAHAAAIRALLQLGDDELRDQVTAELVRQKQEQVRRRAAR